MAGNKQTTSSQVVINLGASRDCSNEQRAHQVCCTLTLKRKEKNGSEQEALKVTPSFIRP
jgi:hypothetical protein